MSGQHSTAGPGTAADADTIVAVATAPGRGGIGIVRLSGPAVPEIAAAILGRLPLPRHAALSPFHGDDGEAIDHGIALYYPAPRSYTGEHVLELQGHGGPVVLDALVERACRLGARVARAGEYTERAFLNGRLDLAQAEAVADLIDSATRTAARGALRSLQGRFSRDVDALLEGLVEVRTLVEAALDFSDEDLPLPAGAEVADRLARLRGELDELRGRARSGALLRDGVHIALAGAPNVGKSSLLNALAGNEAAIVSELPGTTRDPVRVDVDLDGTPAHIVDTAGLREDPERIEAEGIRRAREAIESADIVLRVIDDSMPGPPATMPELDSCADRLVIVRNKIDLSGHPPGLVDDDGRAAVAVSAATGSGMEDLRQYLCGRLGLASAGEGTFTARRRHLDALSAAAGALADAADGLDQDREPELVAEDLRRAQEDLGRITGSFCADDLLGRIFSTFCIGK